MTTTLTAASTFSSGQTAGVSSQLNTIVSDVNALIGSSLGRKNALINAVGFPINQRGASSYTATGYTADRWFLSVGSGATVSLGVAAPGPGTAPGYALNYLAFNRTVAGTGNSYISQKIESVSTLAGQTCTLSLLCAAGSGAIDFSPQLNQVFGTGGSPSATVSTVGATLTATTTFQTLSYTFTLPSINGKTLGTNGDDCLVLYLSRAYNATNGATGNLQILAVQLELGSAFTGWEVPPVADTLAACQRYYYRQTSTSTVNFIGSAVATSATNVQIPVRWPVRMRTAPTMAFSSGTAITTNGAASVTSTALASNGPLVDSTTINATVASVTVGQAFNAYLNANGAWFDASAEL